MIATLLLTATAVPLLSKGARVVDVTTFPTGTVEGHISYQPGGRTKQRTWAIVGQVTQKPIVFVLNAGYFDTKSDPLVAVDFVLSKGKVLVPYRRDLSRPIIAFGDNGEIRIFSGENGKPYDDFLSWQAQVGCMNAVAGDNSAIEPSRKTLRRVVGLRQGEFVIITLASATDADCRSVIERYQLEQFAFMDGGSSMLPNALCPTHMVFFARPQAGGTSPPALLF